ncbi:hypothetical protein Golax_005372, partial [Gossypium laxum]|nr:hypothetical protein [Gossypium laxum]
MPLKFLVAPDLPQLPPFLLGKPSCRNIKWSLKMFNEIMRVAVEMVVLDSSLLNNDETVSLTDDMDEMRVIGNRIYNDVKFTTMSTKVHKVTDPKYTMDSVGLKLFDDLCPIELKFDVPILNFVLMYALCLIEEWDLVDTKGKPDQGCKTIGQTQANRFVKEIRDPLMGSARGFDAGERQLVSTAVKSRQSARCQGTWQDIASTSVGRADVDAMSCHVARSWGRDFE